MDISQIWEWLSVKKNADAITSLAAIVGIVASIIYGIWVLIKSRSKETNHSKIGKIGGVMLAAVGGYIMGVLSPPKKTKNNSNSDTNPASHYPFQDKHVDVTIEAKGNAKVKVNTGDTHKHYGYDDEKVAQLVAKLAQKFREEDRKEASGRIKELEATIKALTEQPANQPGIKEALDMLSQGKTELAENIFARIALEEKQKGQDAQQKGKEANIKEAEALRHLGSLALLHDTQKALDAFKRSTELDPDNMDGWNQLGLLYHTMGELGKAENAYRTILKIAGADQTNQAVAQAVAYGNLGSVYQTRGELDQAVEYHNKSLIISIELGYKRGIASNYGSLGTVYLMRGELDQAVGFYQKALGLNEELGAKEGMASNYAGLGLVYQTCWKLDQAVEFYQKALMLYQALGAKEGMANQYGNLGIVYHTREELDQAVEYYQKSLALNEALERKEGMAIQYANLGNVHETRGDLDQALAYYQKALALNEALGSKQGMAGDYGNLGTAYKILGKLDKAVEYWKKSLTLYTEVGMKPRMAQVQSWLDDASSEKNG